MGAQPGVIGTATMEPDHRTIHEIPRLPRASVVRVEDGQKMLVRARSGCVWLTQEGERRDVVLLPGQQFRISRDGCTLIQALRDSEIDLLYPDGQHHESRIDVVHPGAARVLQPHRSGRGLRGFVTAVSAQLTQAWLRLYARPPRRARQFL